MHFSTIGLMTPGDMGQALAIQIQAQGYRVCTALDRRSERSRRLAKDAGLTDLESIPRLIAECEVVLSVMNPGAALQFAREAAVAIQGSPHAPLFVDCNAIAPETAREIASLIEAAGARLLDASIIGPPPRRTAKTDLYVSGPGADDILQLGGPQISVHIISDRIGDASALKMCFGALNKGTQALWLEVLIAARHLGVGDALEQQLRRSRADLYEWALTQFPALPPKAYRWVPEMLEIAKTLAAAGITPMVFQGAAEIYAFVAATPLGNETPESRDKTRSGNDVVRTLAQNAESRRLP
jgi:3-hydroxyisobutyrate dehydrogenase-like beta-hydroxyacid dehydrogenase